MTTESAAILQLREAITKSLGEHPAVASEILNSALSNTNWTVHPVPGPILSDERIIYLMKPELDKGDGGYLCDMFPAGVIAAGRAIEADLRAALAAVPGKGEPADPMDWKIPCDVKVGAGTNKKGTRFGVLVARMNVLHGMAMKAFPQPSPVSGATSDEAKPQMVTLTGHQIKVALDFINPDGVGDPMQLDDDLSFAMIQHRDDDGVVRHGMCCWNDDSDGVLPLDESPDSAIPSPQAPDTPTGESK